MLKACPFELLRRSLGRHSEILEYHMRSQKCRVIVKRITGGWRKPADAEAKVLREFQSLQIVRKSLPAILLHTVPTPLVALPASKTLVLEQLPGRPMSAILKLEANRAVGRLRTGRMVALGRFAGQWLKELHQATRVEPRRHDSGLFMDTLEQRIIRCQTLGVTEEVIDLVRRRTSDVSRRLDGYPVPASARQGDFTPQNILVDGNRLGVVDFENFCETDSVYEDVATFRAYIQALSAFPYYSRTALRTLATSFLQAYGLTGDEAIVRLYLARALVVLISETNLSRAVLSGHNRLRLLQAQLQRICSCLRSPVFAA